MSVPWIQGGSLASTNEEQCRWRFCRVERKLSQDPNLKKEYEKIVKDQLEEGVVEATSEIPAAERTFYMPHKPVVRETASTAKVKIVFDASAKPHPLGNSINRCMYTGPPLQPLLRDILIRARMSTHILMANIQKHSERLASERKIEVLSYSCSTQTVERNTWDSPEYPLEESQAHSCLGLPSTITTINKIKNVKKPFKP